MNDSPNTEPRYPQVIVDVPEEQVDESLGLLFELGAEGVEERDQSTLVRAQVADRVTLVASFADETTADQAVLALDPGLSPRRTAVVGDAWRDAWKESFRPFRLTDHVIVRPPWEQAAPDNPGDIVLELEPGRAFGTGLHASTRGVARAIEAHADEARGSRVLDVGTGSGILLIVALALGAIEGRGIDIDAESLLCARENAARNGMSDRLSFTADLVGTLAETYDLVLANIEAGPLISMANDLMARTRPGGLLILAGVLGFQADTVQQAFRRMNLESAEPDGEWVCLVFRRSPGE